MKEVQCLLIACAVVFSPATAAAEEPASEVPAVRLLALLDERKLQAFAAELPSAPGRFAAVLYIPGVQMLAVSAAYPAPQLLRDLISAGDYRQVYVDLSTAADRDGRLFVEDLGAPGLRPAREDDGPFDITWRDVTKRVNYDGEWRTQKLSEAEYRQRFEADDTEYAEVLTALIAALNAPSTAAAALGAPAPAPSDPAPRTR